MGEIVVTGAMLSCPFGSTPSNLKVTSQTVCTAGGQFAATIQDAQGMVNIQPFGMCSSLANPQVASATAAALGVLQPQPCMPMTTGVWSTSCAATLIDGKPCLTNDSKIVCTNGKGTIQITYPGQRTVSTK